MVEEELATPGREDNMMELGAAAAAASGYGAGAASSSGPAAAADTGHISDTAVVPIKARTQAFEEQIKGNLRGGMVAGPTPRWGTGAARVPWSTYHKRSDSGASTASATSAASAASTATTVAMPKQMREQIDIDILINLAKDRRREWNKSEDIETIELSMEVSDLMYKIEKLRSGIIPKIEELRSGHKSKTKSKTKEAEDTAAAIAASAASIKAKKRLMDIMEMPL